MYVKWLSGAGEAESRKKRLPLGLWQGKWGKAGRLQSWKPTSPADGLETGREVKKVPQAVNCRKLFPLFGRI